MLLAFLVVSPVVVVSGTISRQLVLADADNIAAAQSTTNRRSHSYQITISRPSFSGVKCLNHSSQNRGSTIEWSATNTPGTKILD